MQKTKRLAKRGSKEKSSYLIISEHFYFLQTTNKLSETYGIGVSRDSEINKN